MPIRLFLVFAFVLFLGALAGAEEPDSHWRPEERDRHYLERLTPEERQVYREKLWALKTEAERERFREAQQRMLDERARALPQSPMAEEGKPPAAKERQWPDDGLRRWPQERSAENGLRRWKAQNLLAGKEERQETAMHWRERGDKEGERREGETGKGQRSGFAREQKADRKTP